MLIGCGTSVLDWDMFRDCLAVVEAFAFSARNFSYV
jgi:hypothetical protein